MSGGMNALTNKTTGDSICLVLLITLLLFTASPIRTKTKRLNIKAYNTESHTHHKKMTLQPEQKHVYDFK